MGVRGQRQTRQLYPRERNPVPIYRRLRESPKTDLDGCGKCRFHRHSFPGMSSRYTD
jgi:hypothetical protein